MEVVQNGEVNTAFCKGSSILKDDAILTSLVKILKNLLAVLFLKTHLATTRSVPNFYGVEK